MTTTNDIKKAYSNSLGQLLRETTEFIFSKSQENLTKPVPFEAGRRNMSPSAITDKGTLLNSGRFEFSGDEGVILYDAPYASYIEWGTAPHLPPIEPIIEWCMRKLGKSRAEAEKMARKIQMTIGKYGTNPHPFIRPAISEAERYFSSKRL